MPWWGGGGSNSPGGQGSHPLMVEGDLEVALEDLAEDLAEAVLLASM